MIGHVDILFISAAVISEYVEGIKVGIFIILHAGHSFHRHIYMFICRIFPH